MQPKILTRPEMTLVGIVGTGSTVSDVDIAGLWKRFISLSQLIAHQVDPEKGYELHIHQATSPQMHFCLVGVAVKKIEALPIEIFAKVVPAGRYAVFTHTFSHGGFGEAFKAVYAWLEGSPYQFAHPFDIQVYDERFKGADDSESVIEILVPIEEK